MYDKALMNAIIHDGYIPGSKTIHIVCDRCGSQLLFIPYERHDWFESENGKSSMYLCQCPLCGEIELNCVATYYLPDVFPATILVFVGHFISLMSMLKGWMKGLRVDTK